MNAHSANTVILHRPGIAHSVKRQLRVVAELRSEHRSAPEPRRPRIARLIAGHEADLAALDAIEDPEYLAACLLAGAGEVRHG